MVVPVALVELLAALCLVVGFGFAMIMLAVGIGQQFTDIGDTFL
jgi:hypothetical protein